MQGEKAFEAVIYLFFLKKEGYIIGCLNMCSLTDSVMKGWRALKETYYAFSLVFFPSVCCMCLVQVVEVKKSKVWDNGSSSVPQKNITPQVPETPHQ